MNVETAVVSFRAAVSIRCIAMLNLFGTAAICQCGAVYDGSSSLDPEVNFYHIKRTDEVN